MLTTEEKAKRYDDLLVKLQEAKADNDVCDERYCCVIDDIVPELKESEDEKIRKWCISHFRECFRVTSDNVAYQEYLNNKVIPWLEKQGEKGTIGNNEEIPNFAWSEVDKKRIIELIGIFESAIDGGQVPIPYRLLKNYIRILKSCMPQNTTTGADMIREERLRQIETEGYDALHDRHHTPQVLCRAAAAYALYDDQSALIANAVAKLWPWSEEYWKPKDHLRNLVRAGALIAAAIDKLQSEKGE